LIVEDGAAGTLVAEAFSAVLRLEEWAFISFTTSFLEGFDSNNSLLDVLSPAQDEALLRLFAPLALAKMASASEAAVTFLFLTREQQALVGVDILRQQPQR
jgi:hypothetical protein